MPTSIPGRADLPSAPALPVQPPSPYPSGTLHVGVRAGIEEARTYIAFDLPPPSEGEVMVGGTLTLPIATEATAGTARAEAARVRVCYVPGFIRDGTNGDTSGAPAAECTRASPAKYVDSLDGGPPALVVDLGPFVDQWTAARAALAVVPDEDLQTTEHWHVAFYRRDSDIASAVPISAHLDLATRVEDAEAPLERVEFDGGPRLAPGSFAAPPFDIGDLGTGPEEVPAEAEASVVPRRRLDPAASVLLDGFRYPMTFLLPFLIVGAGAWMGRAFTRDLHLPPREGGATWEGFQDAGLS